MRLTRQFVMLSMAILMLVMMVGCAPTSPAPTTAAPAAPTSVAATNPAPASSTSAEKKMYKIGYIQYSSDAYYQMQADAAKEVEKYINANEDFGIEMTFVTSEGKPEKELANIEDFIAKKMDAVIDFTGAAATAQQGAQECNKANIPFFVVGSTAADGPGKVTATIKGDFVQMGGEIGKYIATKYPNSKIAIVEGTLGQGIVEYFEEGFEKNLGPNNKIVIKASGDWNAEKSQNIMSDWLANYHDEFDIVYAMNADIYLGVVRALKDAGKLNNPIKIVTHNGRPEDAKGVEDGDAIGTLANSPTYELGVLLKVVTTFLRTGQVPPLVITPSAMVDKSNIQDILGWELDKGVKAYQDYKISIAGSFNRIWFRGRGVLLRDQRTACLFPLLSGRQISYVRTFFIGPRIWRQ